jgi:serine/threonine-protein kinase RsbW
MGKLKVIKKENKIIIPSSLDYLETVDRFVENKLRKEGWDKDQIADVAISLSEVVTNAIVHGNKSDPQKKVSVQVSLKPDEIMICVTDQGTGFNSSCIPNSIDKENLLKETGRGIFIVRSLMDNVEIENKENLGCCIKITKRTEKKK